MTAAYSSVAHAGFDKETSKAMKILASAVEIPKQFL